jgi:hypothetical protein
MNGLTASKLFTSIQLPSPTVGRLRHLAAGQLAATGNSDICSMTSPTALLGGGSGPPLKLKLNRNTTYTMKTKLRTSLLCVLAFLMSVPPPAFASSDWDQDALSAVVDVTVARPFTFALTILGSVVFVVSLPVAIPSRSVKNTARTLMVGPAKDTFYRPIGNLDGFLDY